MCAVSARIRSRPSCSPRACMLPFTLRPTAGGDGRRATRAGPASAERAERKASRNPVGWGNERSQDRSSPLRVGRSRGVRDTTLRHSILTHPRRRASAGWQSGYPCSPLRRGSPNHRLGSGPGGTRTRTPTFAGSCADSLHHRPTADADSRRAARAIPVPAERAEREIGKHGGGAPDESVRAQIAPM